MINYIYLIIAFIVIINILTIVFYNYYNKLKNRLNNNTFNNSEYDLIFKELDDIIALYYNSYLVVEIKKLNNDYNINPNDKINAIQQYNEKVIEKINLSCKAIITQYLNNNLKTLLFKYCTEDYLILYIVKKLSNY